jgi:flagellar motor switch protein FliN/FliY
MSPDAQLNPFNPSSTLKDARTQPMPAKTNDQKPFGEGDLNQELIDQMLNGGDPAGTVNPDPWVDDTLPAEIDAARAATGGGVDAGGPTPITSLVDRVPSAAHAAQAPTAVHPIQFMPLTPELPSMDHGHGIELLMDVALEVSVELGRSHMSIGEILALRTGSVIELDKLAGEPVDVSVNGTLIARGEVVVVDEKFGVRITEVVSKARRLATVG